MHSDGERCEACVEGWVVYEDCDKQKFKPCEKCNFYEALLSELKEQKRAIKQLGKIIKQLQHQSVDEVT